MVVWLVGDTDTRFFPDAPIIVVTVSPSTGQLPSPVIVTVILPLIFLFSVNLVGDIANELALHTGVTVGVGVVVVVAIGVIVGISDGIAVGTVVGVAVGVLVGVTDVVIAGVGVGMSVIVKLESWTLDEPS